MLSIVAGLFSLYAVQPSSAQTLIPGFGAPSTGGAASGCQGGSALPCTSTANCQSPCAMGEFMVATPNFDCKMAGSCAASTFNIQGGMNSITFGTAYAAYGSTFNLQGGLVIAIECGSGFCGGATFNVLPGADFSDLKCDEYQGCGAGCTVCQGGQCQDCYNVATT
jgi:hypothetical protein